MTVIAALLPVSAAMSADGGDRSVRVLLETELGDITLAVDLERAPQAGAYFLRFVDRGRYDGATIYRAASLDEADSPQLVQGGLLQGALVSNEHVNLAELDIETLPDFETTAQSGLQHDYATVSLARDLLYTGDVIPEFVIYLRRAPQVDEGGADKPDRRGYPVIGRVVAGMDVVRIVTTRERDGPTTITFLRGQVLTEPVRIHRAARIADEPGTPGTTAH
jgi:peptidyl-prolyl cis-trans isomerase A (cyclophilin A)